MVKITNKKISTILFTILSIVLLTVSISAIEYTGLNELRSMGVAKDLAHDIGYMNGYEDRMQGKGSQPATMVNNFRRVNIDDPDYLASEMAYRYKGKYTHGYKKGYTDAKEGKESAVPDDYLYRYGAIKENTVHSRLGTTVYKRSMLEELDFDQGLENLAYEIGYNDAKENKAKAPLKIMYDLEKDQSTEVRQVYREIRHNRGMFTKRYKEGYEDRKTEEDEGKVIITRPARGTLSKLASQQPAQVQEDAAYEVGYKFGVKHATNNELSRPHTLLRYDWILNARYTDTGEHENRNWYNLPDGITRLDVEQADADRTAYLKGYRFGYDVGKMRMKEEPTTDKERVFQMGCDLALEGGNPYTYNWINRRYAQDADDLDFVTMVRRNRAELLKGYRDCKATQ